MIKQKIKEAAEKHPGRIAYRVKEESITYKELWEEAEKYAGLLKKQGASPVIIIADKSVSTVVSILACVLSGRTYIPLDPAVPLQRVKEAAEMSEAGLVISGSPLPLPLPCVTLDELSHFENESEKQVSGDKVYIIFTSGSTGSPKGVPISRSNLENFVSWISSLEPLKSYRDITVMNQASFGFDLSVADLYYSLCNGHTLISAGESLPEDYEGVLGTLSQAHAAVMTPTFMKMLLLDRSFSGENFPLLRCVFFCGERLDTVTAKKLHSRFPGIEIINAYGPTEATCAVSAVRITPETAEKFPVLPVGEAAAFATDISIENGEIVLGGASVFSGYLGKEKGGYFSEKGINRFRTGDLGYIENGLLFCKGRRDNQLKYKGYRIEAEDIENNVCAVKGIERCAVVPVYNNASEIKYLAAHIVAGEDITAEHIRSELERLLPQYMIPSKYIFEDSLPVTRNGKIDRKKLSGQ